MAIELKSTRREVHHVKLTVYGVAGAGKTMLCSTAPKPVIISAEAGLLSLADKDIPVYEIANLGELREAFMAVKQDNGQFQTVCLDSISDIAEQVLDAKMSDLQKAAEEAGGKADPRQGYGKLAIEMMQLTRAFRGLDKHIVFTAKQGQTLDENKLRFAPMLPGQQFTQNLPYLMDIVACLRVGKNSERWLQTQPDLQYSAKDRSGKLDAAEKPDLTYLFNKVVSPAKP